MLWFKSLLEVRLRFLVSLSVMAFLAALAVLRYPEVARQGIPIASRGFENYVWGMFFGTLGGLVWPAYAILCAGNGIIPQTSCGATRGLAGAHFTLSLPVSRARLLLMRAAFGLAFLYVVALLGSLIPCGLAPLLGQRYPVGTALVHAHLLFGGGLVYFGIATATAVVLDEYWHTLATLSGIWLVYFTLDALHDRVGFPLSDLVNGRLYHTTGQIAWSPILFSALLCGLLLWLAVWLVERREF